MNCHVSLEDYCTMADSNGNAPHVHVRAKKHEDGSSLPSGTFPALRRETQVGPFSSGGTVKSVYGSSWQASTHASSAMRVRESTRSCW